MAGAEIDDPHDLQRFVDAQELVFDRVLTELRSGRKSSHWMWFVFPQVAGLGRSDMSACFAIHGRGEALAYLRHPLLGPRLDTCVTIVADLEGKTALEILGSPDDLKFRSCLTLFLDADPHRHHFRRALDKYFEGTRDQLTLELVRRASERAS